MLVRIAGHFFNVNDVFHAEFSAENLQVILVRGEQTKMLEFTGGDAEYLQTILDANHAITVQELRDQVPADI